MLDEKLRESIRTSRMLMDREVAAVLSAPPPDGPLFEIPRGGGPPPSAFCRALTFRNQNGRWVPTGDHKIEYLNPARRIYEQETVSRAEFLKQLCPEIVPRAVCKTLYRTAVEIGSVPAGSFVCSACEEIWTVADILKAAEHELDGLCIRVDAQYRTEPARVFYAWCLENGYCTGPAPR